MPAFLVPLAISGISALAGMLANRKKQATQEQTSTTTATEMPQYDDQTRYMRDMLMNQYQDRLRFGDDFYGGYAKEGLSNINQGADLAQERINTALASRGLGGTTAGAASSVSNIINSMRQGNTLLNSIPLLKDQRQQQTLQLAGDFFSRLPTGKTTTSTSKGTGTVNTPGNVLGGGLTSLATTLGGMYGLGAFGGPKPWWQTLGKTAASVVGGIGSAGANDAEGPLPGSTNLTPPYNPNLINTPYDWDAEAP